MDNSSIDELTRTANHIRDLYGEDIPRTAIILGSGLSPFSDEVESPLQIPYVDLPAFCEPTVAGHIGRITIGSVEDLIITNAAGSLRKDMQPGELMLIQDHINFSFFIPLIGANDESLGPGFVDLSDAWALDLRSVFLDAAKTAGVELASGVYVQYSGPNFETPAEIRMFR